MKASKNSSYENFVRKSAALLSVFALLASTFALGISAQQRAAAQAARLSEEQRILHVLNRLGFGARPGDVERVRAMGLDRYIEQQLHPEAIPDAATDARVKNLPSLAMTTAEIYQRYPQPNLLIRQMQRRGDLPPELAAIAEARQQNRNNQPQTQGAPPASNSNQMAAPGAMANPQQPGMSQDEEAARRVEAALGQGDDNNNRYRQAMRQYYIEHGLRQPQALIGELQASRILRAVYSERQLQEVMLDFWTNHFNVFAGKGADRWLLTSYDRDTIRPHTMGSFYDLLVAVAESPAMLFYLDNFQSVSPNAPQGGAGQRARGQNRPLFNLLMGGRTQAQNERAQQQQIRRQQAAVMSVPPQRPEQVQVQQRARRGINENYARELMELHTLGVDGGYTQHDVQEVARCFTGWTIFNPRGGLAFEGAAERAGTFIFNARVHDNGEKIVLGHKIPAGGGMNDGLMVLDILAHHPSTAKFLAKKLSQRFVSDEPSQALIDRVAQAYMRTGGDIRETLKALFTSPEFNSSESYRAKIKQPFELAVSAIRTLGGDTNGAPGLQQWIARMGQPLYGYQTPNGYADVAEAWVNTGALLERLNFGLALASNRIPGTRVDLAKFTGVTSGAADQERIMDR
ncbi:MAG TPA: DUF1800 domain-containing protein, partial [Pyrinomonadaceae bacterium]|nr:DUF1800 domain-containing protein [Pyrinomonadaceae bacterium]